MKGVRNEKCYISGTKVLHEVGDGDAWRLCGSLFFMSERAVQRVILCFYDYLICQNIPYRYYLVYLHKITDKIMAKVIHVHLLKRGRFERKDYYFASISAIYTVLTPEDVGVTKNYLLHAGLSGNGSVATKCAMIQQSTLIRCKRQTEDGK